MRRIWVALRIALSELRSSWGFRLVVHRYPSAMTPHREARHQAETGLYASARRLRGLTERACRRQRANKSRELNDLTEGIKNKDAAK
jgi:hypothetical protein